MSNISITRSSICNIASFASASKHNEDVTVYNSQATVKLKNDGKIMLDTSNNIEFNCAEFKVNGQTMIVP